jgi:hypothetical protein
MNETGRPEERPTATTRPNPERMPAAQAYDGPRTRVPSDDLPRYVLGSYWRRVGDLPVWDRAVELARFDRGFAPVRLGLLRSELATATAYRDLVRGSNPSRERRDDAERWVERVAWKLATAEAIAANRRRLDSPRRTVSIRAQRALRRERRAGRTDR